MLVREAFGFNSSRGEIGIEIEAEGPYEFPVGNLIPSSWVATSDGSLRGNAVEYVTNGPLLPEKVDDELEKLQAALIRNKTPIVKSFRAGVHIHINVREMNMDQIATFAAVYFILEPALVRFCGENREGNLFCLRLEDAEAPLFFLQDALKSDDFRTFATDNIRYSALNFRSITRHGSLEFRSMETNPNFEKISEWVKILYGLKEYSLTVSRESLARNISFLGPENWAQQILGPKLFPLIIYEGFNKDVMRSLRRIQMLIYT